MLKFRYRHSCSHIAMHAGTQHVQIHLGISVCVFCVYKSGTDNVHMPVCNVHDRTSAEAPNCI